MLETGINIIEWPSPQYCTMSAFGGDALQRKAMSHKSSFIIMDYIFFRIYLPFCGSASNIAKCPYTELGAYILSINL